MTLNAKMNVLKHTESVEYHKTYITLVATLAALDTLKIFDRSNSFYIAAGFAVDELR